MHEFAMVDCSMREVGEGREGDGRAGGIEKDVQGERGVMGK